MFGISWKDKGMAGWTDTWINEQKEVLREWLRRNTKKTSLKSRRSGKRAHDTQEFWKWLTKIRAKKTESKHKIIKACIKNIKFRALIIKKNTQEHYRYAISKANTGPQWGPCYWWAGKQGCGESW